MGEEDHIVMALPENRLSTEPISASFLSPDNRVEDEEIDWERGGVAINDASQGLDVQDWRAEADGSSIRIFDEADVVRFTLERPGVTAVSLAFDQNMRVTLAYVANKVAYLYWFDTNINDIRDDEYPDIIYPRLGTDDKRPSQNANSDVIFAYVRGGSLYYRQQRDRYTIERLLAEDVRGILRNIGLSTANRFQFEFYGV